MSPSPRVLALSGGVGGAKLVDGLARVLPAEALTVVVNTGDDLRHWGLWISPDVDTVMHTLAGIADEVLGWGRQGESHRVLEGVRRYGGDDWFRLGDLDLATHFVRTEALARGERLTSVTDRLCRAWNIRPRVLPMADTPRPTWIDTEADGTLSFQEWFVRRRAAPRVQAVRYGGEGGITPEVAAALAEADLVVFGPSNPYVSIGPILAVPGVRERLGGKRIVAVSPIVGGRAVKGPLVEMFHALTGREASAREMVTLYGDLLSGMIVEYGDGWSDGRIACGEAATVMGHGADRARLAATVLEFAAALG